MTTKPLFPVVVTFVLGTAGLLNGFRPVAAQAPTAGAPLVHVDVTVVDASGQPVRGLAATDFQVFENERPAVVAGMSAAELPPAPAPVNTASEQALAHSSAWTRVVMPDIVRNDELIDRYVAILIDDVAAVPGENARQSWVAGRGLELAREIVNRLGQHDRASVFFTSLGRRQGLTGDRARLHEAIDGFVPGATTLQACDAAAGPGGCAAAALQRVADSLPHDAPSRTLVVSIGGAAGAPNAVPAGNASEGWSQRLFVALQRANATVYSFGPVGTPIQGGADPARFAVLTGGRAIADTVAPAAQVAALLGEASSFYRIAVRPSVTDGRFLPLAVRVTKPGVEVRTRSGYFAVPSQEPAMTAPTPIEQALLSHVPASTVPLGATVAVIGVPGRREAVVSIATNVTSQAASGATGWQAEVATTAFDREWRPKSSHRQTIEVTARPDGGRQTVDVLSALELLPGRYEVRIAADSGGRAGSVFVDVEVPEFLTKLLSASGAIVTTARKPYAALPLLAEHLPVTPTTRRVFAKDESVEVFLRFYQGTRERLRNMSVSFTITDGAGQGVISGDEVMLPSQFTAARSTDWRFDLPLGRLVAGEYLLSVEATIADERVSRHVRFGVAK